MITNSALEAARQYTFSQLSGDTGGHDWWHAKRVAALARRIAESEGADADFCEFVAILHDIPDDKRGMDEGEGLAMLSRWLEMNNIPRANVEHTMEIISSMSFRGGGRPPMKSLEGMVVQDADRLDALGAIGIARTFAYSGHKGQLIYDPGIPVRKDLTLEEYRNGRSTAINHFHEKLFNLADLMNTGYAKKAARERTEFMKEFVREFMSEWNP